MDRIKLNDILRNHRLWLCDVKNGHRACLDYKDLANMNLSKENLRSAYIRKANLINSDLSNADLRWSSLEYTNLKYANLTGADLSYADLRGANLYGANLSNARFTRADFTQACLNKAKLDGAIDLEEAIPLACPDTGRFIGWKIASGKLVKLEITDDALRSSAASRKCRCNKAKIVGIYELDRSKSERSSIASNFDKTFIYKVGETVSVDNFDTNRFNECAPGIHFFITMQEAINYI